MRNIRTRGIIPVRRIHCFHRIATLVALFALLSSFIVPARPLQMSALAHGTDASDTAETPAAAPPLTPEQAREAYGKVGMSFEANRGQTDDEVKFIARGSGYTLFLTQAEAVFVLRNSDCELRNEDTAKAMVTTNNQHPETYTQSAICNPQSEVLRMKLDGANRQPVVSGREKLAGKVNYFTGNEPDSWHTDIPTFGRVHYAGVYEGVDMVYYGNQQQLEYDFVVAPGANYEQIALSFEGADKVELEAATGDLLLKVGGGTLRQHKPVVYQEVNGKRQEVESEYVQKAAGRIGFAVGAYDARRPLIIDPVLAYSTYLGASGSDSVFGIAVDAAGNTYVTGFTNSTNFPTATPIQATYGGGNSDTFVTKLNASGSALIYSTYLGGSGDENGIDIAVGSTGNAYVTGRTTSANFPTANPIQATIGGGFADAFVTKLNTSGSALVYSTYLGGGGDDSGSDIAVDSTENPYVTGRTSSANFPTANPIQATYGASSDAFVTKFNTSGSALLYSTYLGGSGDDSGSEIAVDSTGNAFVAGRTTSTNFPTANPIQAMNGGGSDVFVTKLNASGAAAIYSTYLGGSNTDFGLAMAVDSVGNAYVTGFTTSTNFPTANPIQPANGGAGGEDAFVTKLNASGSALVYSTYLGGSGSDRGNGIAVDSAGNTYVTGEAFSTNFPTANPIQATHGGGNFDGFVTKLNASGSALVYSTFLGGSGHDSGHGIAVDTAGNAYVTGDASSANFPTTANAFQPARGESGDAFIAKIGDFAISGRVIDSGGTGISGATVTLSGTNSGITQTDGGGYFAFLNTTLNGDYTVTPFKAGFIFSPESIAINDLNSNQELLFIGAPTSVATPTPTPVPTPTPTPTPTPLPTPASFQFSAASFGVSENAGSALITVTRSGDTSSALSVDYATADGTAKDRGDYTTAIGRLHFNAGETVKSFLVFVTDDTYAEGNETVSITLSNPSGGAQFGGSSAVILTIVDNDPVTATSNRIDTTVYFIRQHYIDFLNREPDSAGLAFWTNNIESCGSNLGCREEKRIETSAAFFLSIEFQETGFLAHRLYRASFNCLPRYREFIRDAHEIGSGVVIGQSGWEAQLEANKQAFADEFVTRSEFTAIYGGLNNGQYVDALNANTGGSLSASERNALVAGLNAATETRATVLRKVAEDADFKAREFNSAFVVMQYFGYLRRNPDVPDADFSGYNFWLAKLNSFGGDFRQAEMVKAFIKSSEYRARFGQP